jgi:hypothetical protein
MGVMAMDEFLNKKEGYEITEADQQAMASGQGQLVGQFLIDRGASYAGASQKFWRMASIRSGCRIPSN